MTPAVRRIVVRLRPAPLTVTPATRVTCEAPQSQSPAGMFTVAPSEAVLSAAWTSAAEQLSAVPASTLGAVQRADQQEGQGRWARSPQGLQQKLLWDASKAAVSRIAWHL